MKTTHTTIITACLPCTERADDGTFTVIYTAKMKDQGFWSVGKCTLGWE